jgi:hypothetical protein
MLASSLLLVTPFDRIAGPLLTPHYGGSEHHIGWANMSWIAITCIRLGRHNSVQHFFVGVVQPLSDTPSHRRYWSVHTNAKAPAGVFSYGSPVVVSNYKEHSLSSGNGSMVVSFHRSFVVWWV